VVVVIWTGSRPASAAVVDDQTSQPASQPSIALSSSPTLVQLIDLCALQFGVDIEYSASDAPLTAKLTLRSAGEYTPRELWELTHRMLETKGRTTVLAPGVRRLYRVVSLSEAAAATEPLAAIPAPPPGYIVLRYPVQHAAPETVLAALNEPRPPVWEAAVSADRSDVVVGALTRRHDAVRRVVERLDAEAASVRITLIDVQHADPLAVLAAVNAAKERLPGKLSGTLSQGPRPSELLLTAPEAAIPRWQSLVAQFDVPQSAETRTYPLPNFASDEVETLLEQIARRPGPTGSGDAWKLVRNPLVGTLLVTATPAEHAKVAELLAQIAAIPADQRRATRTFTVRNRNAEDLRESLSRLLGVSIGGAAADPAAAPPAEGQPVRVAGTTPAAGSQTAEPELLLAVDPELNAIIAVGPPHLLDAASDLIARLDVRQPQVLLEVLLVSLSDGQSRDLGVELQARINDSGTLIGLGSLFGLSNISPGSSVPTVSGAGGTAVILNPGDFSVVVRALQSVNRGRSLSRASTLVNNNESANLSNTVTVPYATTTLTDGNTITAFGGSEPAGTTITVSPQIAQGGFLVLDYNVSLSSFLGEATSDGLPPPSQSTSINSIATIPDGYSIVLGGLELLTESDADSKTPLLADLPILGNLFKSSSDSTSRTRFYVLIRASVLNDPGFERLKYYSDTVSEEAEATLGWPTIEPRIIR
jgi:type II secretory pathway component GspD/PulD (secretin)